MSRSYIAHPTMYQRGAIAAGRNPGRCSVSTTACAAKASARTGNASRGSRAAWDEATRKKPTASATSSPAPCTCSFTAANPTYAPAVNTSSSDANWARRRSATSRSGDAGVMRDARTDIQANPLARTTDATASARKPSVSAMCMRSIPVLTHNFEAGHIGSRARHRVTVYCRWPEMALLEQSQWIYVIVGRIERRCYRDVPVGIAGVFP